MILKRVSGLIFMFLLAGCGDDQNVTLVKQQKDNYFNGRTFDDVLTYWSMCESVKWESLDGNNKNIVKFTCVNKNLNEYIGKIQNDLEVGFKDKEKREPSAQELDEMNKILSLKKVQEVFYFKVSNDRVLPYKSGVEYYWEDGRSGYDDIYTITMFSNVMLNLNNFYTMQMRNYEGEQYIPLRYNYLINLFNRITR